MAIRNGQAKRRISATASVRKCALFLLLMLTVIAVIAVIGCTGEASERSELPVEGPASVDASSGGSGASSGESSEDSDDNGHGDDNDGASGGDSEDEEHGGDEDTDTVSNTNPNPSGAGPTLNRAANVALADAEPLNIVTWTVAPTIVPGEVSGEGIAEGGAYLFNPQFEEADGAAFEIYYEGHEDPMVVLLPDLGPMQIWNTFETVATMDWEMEGGRFSFRAYSPLFMDSDPTALELRVYGYDGDGNAALLAVASLDGSEPVGQRVAGAQSGSQASGSSSQANDQTVSASNQNPSGEGIPLDTAPNEALSGSEPLNIVTWTKQPTLSPGELSGEGVIEDGANVFIPDFGEGAPFLLFYKGHSEPLVALLPDLGPMLMWQTDLTVAPMDWEMNDGKFNFRAYSPLFMDSDPSALELRVYGYDGDYNPALLAVSDIAGE